MVATDATTATQLLGLTEVPRMAGCITWYHAVFQNPSGNGTIGGRWTKTWTDN